MLRGLFEEPIKHIIEKLRNVIDNDKHESEISMIVMVGGFSESDILQTRVKEAFPALKIVVPGDAGLAVLKGAVIFGHEPKVISTRICRYTYGVRVNGPFNESKHKEEYKWTTKQGHVVCANIFRRHVMIGQSVTVGKPQTSKIVYPKEQDQIDRNNLIYASSQEDPMYTTDPGCVYIGQINMKTPNTSKGLDRPIEICMTFSSTELEVTAKDVNTGDTVNASFDFL